MRYQSGLITDHAEYAKWRQRSTRKEKVEKKYISARFLKKEKKKKKKDWKGKERLTQLCVFGYKVGQTIFTAFHPPQSQTQQIHFVLTKKV